MKRLRMSAVAAALAVLVGALAAPAAALAYRPFATEDAGVAGEGVFQLEAGGEHARWRNGDVENVLVLTPIYGLTRRLELSLEVPFLELAPDDEPRTAGIGDLGLVAKLQLVEERDGWPALALRGNLKTASGSERRGLGTGSWDAGLVAAASKTWQPVTLHAMLGYSVVLDGAEGRQNVHLFGVALDWAITKALHVAAEVAGNGHPERRGDPDPITGLLGFVYDLTDRLVIDVAARRGFTTTVPAWTVTAGVTLGF